jgi:hypothetical protein
MTRHRMSEIGFGSLECNAKVSLINLHEYSARFDNLIFNNFYRLNGATDLCAYGVNVSIDPRIIGRFLS